MGALVNYYTRVHDECIFSISQDPGWFHGCAMSVVEKVCILGSMLSIAIFKFLITLSLNLCFASEVRQCSMHVSRGDTLSCSRGIQWWPSSSLGVHSCPGLWHIHSSLLGAACRGPSVSWAHIGGSDSSNRMAVILLGVVTPKENRVCMGALTH